MMLIGLNGFGDADADAAACNANPNTEWNGTSCIAVLSDRDLCNAGSDTYWDSSSNSCASISSGSGNAAQKAAQQAQNQSSGSWWSTAITALTKGVVQGSTGPTLVPCISPGIPAGCVVLPVVTPPWYTTPIGMLGIALTLGLGFYIVKK